MKTTIFPARKIITMNPSRPLTTHVAVRDGRMRSLQLVGARRALAEAAYAQAQPGRLVCIALRGELQAERIRAALAACAA